MVRVREDVSGYGQPVKTIVKPLLRQVAVYSYPQFNRKAVGLLLGEEPMLVYPNSFYEGFIRVHVGTDFGWVHVEQVEIEGISFEVGKDKQGNLYWRIHNSFAKPVEAETEKKSRKHK